MSPKGPTFKDGGSTTDSTDDTDDTDSTETQDPQEVTGGFQRSEPQPDDTDSQTTDTNQTQDPQEVTGGFQRSEPQPTEETTTQPQDTQTDPTPDPQEVTGGFQRSEPQPAPPDEDQATTPDAGGERAQDVTGGFQRSEPPTEEQAAAASRAAAAEGRRDLGTEPAARAQPPDIVRGGSDLPPRAVPEDAAQELEAQLERAVAEQEIERAGIRNPAVRQQVADRINLDRGEDFRIVRTDQGFRAELTEEFQREQATQRLESQLEAEAGVDLQPGTDFDVVRTDQGFQAVLTSTGQQKVQDRQEQTDAGLAERIVRGTREEVSPLVQLAVPADRQEQAAAGERAIFQRAQEDDFGAEVFQRGEVIQRAGVEFGDAVSGAIQAGQEASDRVSPPRVIEAGAEAAGVDVDIGRGPIETVAETEVGGAGATVEEQAAGFVGGAAEFPILIAGGGVQAAGVGIMTTESVAAGEDPAVSVEAAEEAGTQAVASQAEFARERPVEAGLVVATPAVVGGRGALGRARGRVRAARSSGRARAMRSRIRSDEGVSLRGARVRGRAEAIRSRISEEIGRAREFVGEERGQRALLEQPARERAGGERATDLRQMRPREQGPTRRSAGVDVSFGERPGRSGIEGQRSFAERVREFERLKRADEPDLPPVPRLPAETRTGGVEPVVPAPAVAATDVGPAGVEEDTTLPETTEERITQFFEEQGVEDAEQRAQAVLAEPGEGTLVEDVQGQRGQQSLQEQVQQAQEEQERVIEQQLEATPQELSTGLERTGERERTRSRERVRETPAEQTRERAVPDLTQRTRTGEDVGVPTGRTNIPLVPTPETPDRPGPGTPGPPGLPAGLLGLGVGPLDAAAGRGPAAAREAEPELLTFGFGAETFSVFGTGRATAPTQAALAAQPFSARAAGALPTAELLAPGTRRRIEAVPQLLGGVGLGLGGDGGDGADAADADGGEGLAFDLSIGLGFGEGGES